MSKRHDFNRRMDDQEMILEAILIVKRELETCDIANWMESGKIVLRLANLYSLLDITRLLKLVEKDNARKLKLEDVA